MKMQTKTEWINGTPYVITSEGKVFDDQGQPVELIESKKGYMLIPMCGNAGNMTRLMPKLFLQLAGVDRVWVHADGDYKNLSIDNYISVPTHRRLPIEVVATKVGKYAQENTVVKQGK